MGVSPQTPVPAPSTNLVIGTAPGAVRHAPGSSSSVGAGRPGKPRRQGEECLRPICRSAAVAATSADDSAVPGRDPCAELAPQARTASSIGSSAGVAQVLVPVRAARPRSRPCQQVRHQFRSLATWLQPVPLAPKRVGGDRVAVRSGGGSVRSDRGHRPPSGCRHPFNSTASSQCWYRRGSASLACLQVGHRVAHAGRVLVHVRRRMAASRSAIFVSVAAMSASRSGTLRYGNFRFRFAGFAGTLGLATSACVSRLSPDLRPPFALSACSRACRSSS